MKIEPEIVDGKRIYRLNKPNPDQDISISMTTTRFSRQMVEAIGKPALEAVLVLAKVMSWNKDDTTGIAKSVEILTPHSAKTQNSQKILANLYRTSGSGSDQKIELGISINFDRISFINCGQCLIAMPEIAALAAVKKKLPIDQIVALPEDVEVTIERWSTSLAKLAGRVDDTCLLRCTFSYHSRSLEDIVFIGTPPQNYP